MLIQVPRGPSEQAESERAGARDAFESALRRDLASAPVVSYELVLGGWGKRAADVATVVLTSPLWLLLLALTALYAKLRYGKAFSVDERVGYGGRPFRRFKLHLPRRQAQDGEEAAAESEQERAWRVMTGQALGRDAKWRYAFERLPQLFNVLRGDMSVIGPTPLSREQVEAMKSGKRHYLSARPGVIGVTGVLSADDDLSLQYKAYAMSWSFLTDAVIFWDAAHSLPKRGELWRPGLARPKPAPQPAVLIRRRSSR